MKNSINQSINFMHFMIFNIKVMKKQSYKFKASLGWEKLERLFVNILIQLL